MFAGGVNRTKYPILCQAVSAIHTLILLQNLKCLSPLLPKGKCMIIVLFMKKHSSICSDVSPGGSSSASRAPVLQPFCHVRLTILLSTGSCQVLCFSLDQVAPRRLVTCELDASRPANGAGPRNRVGSFPPPRDWPRDRSTEKGPTATPPPPPSRYALAPEQVAGESRPQRPCPPHGAHSERLCSRLR